MPNPYFGNYPAEYNRAIHGPYMRSRYYGKPDTPLADVKIRDLRSWIWRRNVHPQAIVQATARWYYRWVRRFYEPRYASPLVWSMQMIAVAGIFFYWTYYPHLRHERWRKYHW